MKKKYKVLEARNTILQPKLQVLDQWIERPSFWTRRGAMKYISHPKRAFSSIFRIMMLDESKYYKHLDGTKEYDWVIIAEIRWFRTGASYNQPPKSTPPLPGPWRKEVDGKVYVYNPITKQDICIAEENPGNGWQKIIF